MAVTLLASQCPAPVLPTESIYIGNSGDAPLTSYEFAQGMAAGFTVNLNAQGKRLDLGMVYGGGGYAVCTGLSVSAGTGLQATVSAGKAQIGGIVEKSASFTVVLSASSTNWIWLKQDGTFTVATTTAKPAGECVCLGAAITDGSGVTSVETSGVVYLRSGTFWRQTADLTAPLDSPNASLRIFTQTTWGTYFWDGTAHRQVVASGSPHIKEQTVSYTDLQTASTTKTFNMLSLPSKTVVMGVKTRVSTAFGGASIMTLSFDIGITGTATRYQSGINGLTAASTYTQTGWAESDSGTTQTTFKATATGANLSALTAGAATCTFILAQTT